MVRSEICAEITATKAALAGLRKAILTLTPASNTTRKRRMTTAVANAEILRRLDRLYTCHTGDVLVATNAPIYRGPLYMWKSSQTEVTSRVISALIRIRRSADVGVHTNTAFHALNYFASIWPDTVLWPTDIPRPIEANPKSEKDAA